MFFDPGIPDLFEVSTCSLDEPEKFSPVDQCWTNDELKWAGKCCELPRYDKESPLPG